MWYERKIKMNKVILNGKITQIKEFDKVTYFTVCVRHNKEYEFIPVTTFDTIFFKRYFEVGKWICIEGYMHINKHNEKYSTEIITENINFSGDASDIDKEVASIFRESKKISSL